MSRGGDADEDHPLDDGKTSASAIMLGTFDKADAPVDGGA